VSDLVHQTDVNLEAVAGDQEGQAGDAGKGTFQFRRRAERTDLATEGDPPVRVIHEADVFGLI